MVKIGIFADGYKKNPDILSIQTTGGFALKSLDQQSL